eukprot:m.47070 g.47070  ORF g.47070 m.47070 type:complete len:80 (-) comp17595_c1_seq1:378-617(-)
MPSRFTVKKNDPGPNPNPNPNTSTGYHTAILLVLYCSSPQATCFSCSTKLSFTSYRHNEWPWRCILCDEYRSPRVHATF